MHYLLCYTHSQGIANIEHNEIPHFYKLYGHVEFHPDYDTVQLQDYIYEIEGDNEQQERNVDTPPTYVTHAPKSLVLCY